MFFASGPLVRVHGQCDLRVRMAESAGSMQVRTSRGNRLSSRDGICMHPDGTSLDEVGRAYFSAAIARLDAESQPASRSPHEASTWIQISPSALVCSAPHAPP